MYTSHRRLETSLLFLSSVGQILNNKKFRSTGHIPLTTPAHWVEVTRKARQVAGRRARRIMLATGIWDPRSPISIDPNSTAFYYSSATTALDDETLLSSSDDDDRDSDEHDDDEHDDDDDGDDGAGGGRSRRASRRDSIDGDAETDGPTGRGRVTSISKASSRRLISAARSGSSGAAGTSGGALVALSAASGSSSNLPGGRRPSQSLVDDNESRTVVLTPKTLRVPYRTASAYCSLVASALQLGTMYPTFVNDNVSSNSTVLLSANDTIIVRRPPSTTGAGASAGAAGAAGAAASGKQRTPAVSGGGGGGGGGGGATAGGAWARGASAVYGTGPALDGGLLSAAVTVVCGPGRTIGGSSSPVYGPDSPGGGGGSGRGGVSIASDDGPLASGGGAVVSAGSGVLRAGSSSAGIGAGGMPGGSGAGASTAVAVDRRRRGQGDVVYRPSDVGDGSGYRGQGEASFLAAEKGWTGSGVGIVHGFAPAAKDEVPDDGSWGSKPRGLLLATCRYHVGAVVDVVTCQDHSFFVSGGADGACAVWLSNNINRCVRGGIVWMMCAGWGVFDLM